MSSSSREALEEALRGRLGWRRLERSNRSVTGASCINSGLCYKFERPDDGLERHVFIKTNATRHAPAMFQGELESLKRIQATRTVRVPEPVVVLRQYDSNDTSAIVMEYFELEDLSETGAIKLGRDLAGLHDYNNKVIRYNKRARKWIGGKPPSAAAALQQARNNQLDGKRLGAADDDDDDDRRHHDVAADEEDKGRHETDEDEEEEEAGNRFAKHSMSVAAMRNKTTTTAATPATAAAQETGKNNDNEDGQVQFAERFLPHPDAEEEINQFGFHVPTSCGLIPQVNAWTDDWVAFYARHRLDKSIRSLLSDHGDRELHLQWSYLQLKVDKFFSDLKTKEDKIVPALLHGDLWSGNVAQLASTCESAATAGGSGCQPVLYDPSSFYGHSEYDFGIARMFGGISKQLEQSYFELLPKRKLFEQRNKLYQLFHHLNHWDHFGSGYRASSIKLLKDLNAAQV